MKRIEKIAKKQLDDDPDSVSALSDRIISSIEVYRKVEERNIAEANLNIQKAISNITTGDIDEILESVVNNMASIDASEQTLALLDKASEYIFEEINERGAVTGFKTKKQ